MPERTHALQFLQMTLFQAVSPSAQEDAGIPYASSIPQSAVSA
jgi:hypothetical protein